MPNKDGKPFVRMTKAKAARLAKGPHKITRPNAEAKCQRLSSDASPAEIRERHSAKMAWKKGFNPALLTRAA